LLEEGAEASGDLPQLLRVLKREALVGEQGSAVERDVEEISGVGRRPGFLYGQGNGGLLGRGLASFSMIW